MILIRYFGFKSPTPGTGYAPIADRWWVAGPYKFPNINEFPGVSSPRNFRGVVDRAPLKKLVNWAHFLGIGSVLYLIWLIWFLLSMGFKFSHLHENVEFMVGISPVSWTWAALPKSGRGVICTKQLCVFSGGWTCSKTCIPQKAPHIDV